MNISSVSSSQAVDSQFDVKVVKGQEEQHEQVVKKLLDSVAESSPAEARAGHSTGQKVNFVA